MSKKLHLIWIFLLLFGFSDYADARTVRCGNKVIRVGDTAEYVRDNCGEPASVERQARLFSNGGTLGERCFYASVTIERWTYKLTGSIRIIVTVVEGKVERIRHQTGGFESGWRSPCG